MYDLANIRTLACKMQTDNTLRPGDIKVLGKCSFEMGGIVDF